MPLYEYVCESCGRSFEAMKSISRRNEDDRCPDCEGTARRVLSAFATRGDGGSAGPAVSSGPACGTGGG